VNSEDGLTKTKRFPERKEYARPFFRIFRPVGTCRIETR